MQRCDDASSGQRHESGDVRGLLDHIPNRFGAARGKNAVRAEHASLDRVHTNVDTRAVERVDNSIEERWEPRSGEPDEDRTTRADRSVVRELRHDVRKGAI